MGDGMKTSFQVLGAVSVNIDDAPLPIESAMLRGVLARLDRRRCTARRRGP
jgi:hypothetical protein